MDGLLEKTANTSRGLVYRYWTSPASANSSDRPALLMLHGFPDSAVLWSRMLPELLQLSNRLIIPDLLGYGGTSKPTDPTEYAYHLMVKDLLDILDAEKITRVISLGHDHGAILAARLYNHASDRIVGLILLNVAYVPANKKAAFKLDAVNAAGMKAFGYPHFDYWRFMTAPDAAQILTENADRQWEVANCDSFEDRRDWFCSSENLRKYLTDRSVPRLKTKPYANDVALRKSWIAHRKEDGFAASLCWYLALTQGIQSKSDELVPDDAIKINVPFLFLGCDQDAACRPEAINLSRDAGLTPDLTVEVFEGVSHRPMYERPVDTAKLMMDFVKQRGL